jgi:hypothetical protein
MAHFKQHLTIGTFVGTIAGAGLYIYQYFKEKEENPEVRFNWGKFIM